MLSVECRFHKIGRTLQEWFAAGSESNILVARHQEDFK
jgi:hypothetical protein